MKEIADYTTPFLSSELLGQAYDNNWFKLFVPKRYGGEELSITAGCDQVFSASRINGSLGWCVNLGSGASLFCGYLDEQGAEEIFRNKNAVIAGSGKIGTAIKVPGGYTISGEWDKCTGAAHATAFTVNAKTEDEICHSFVLLPQQAEVVNQWELFALKSSSSHMIKTDHTFVPDHLVFDIGKCNNATSYAIHRLAFDDFARFCMISSLLGITQCFSDKVHKDDFLFPSRVKDEINRLNLYITSSLKSVLDLSGKFQQIADDNLKPDETLQLKLKDTVSTIARSLFDQTNDIYYKGGLRLADENALAHHAYKDVLLACQHYILK